MLAMVWKWLLIWIVGAAQESPVQATKRHQNYIPLGMPRVYLERSEPSVYYPPDTFMQPIYYAYPYQDEEQPEYVPEQEDPYSATNKLFLRNLILSQMYEDAMNGVVGDTERKDDNYDDSGVGYVYGEKIDEPSQMRRDEEVSQLESLRQDKRNEENGKAVDKKSERSVKRSYQPSPYDSLKRLLYMQDKMDEESTKDKTQHKRSYVPSEQSLVEQLGNLKKSD